MGEADVGRAATSSPGNGDRPAVSVLMPVRNGMPYLRAAVDSVLAQTFDDFEVIAVDDGSSDGSADLLASAAALDPRIRVVPGPQLGVAPALNEALAHARGALLARMDADDLAEPTRFERQVTYLLEHPGCGVVGTGYRYIDDEGLVTGSRRVPTSPEEVRASLVFGNPIAHPSVMLNRAVVGDAFRYRTDVLDAEDYVAWVELSHGAGPASVELGNVAEILLSYRKHPASVTAAKRPGGRQSAVDTLVSTLRWPTALAQWSLGRSYNASEADRSIVQFVAAVLVVNLLNVVQPEFQRRALLKRSLLSGAALIRRRALRSRS